MPIKTKAGRAAYNKDYHEENGEAIREKKRVYYLANREKKNAKGRAYYHSHKEERRLYHRAYNCRKKYGITLEERAELFKNGCEICGKQDCRLFVDHDHITNKVRGCLCFPHNTLIGKLGDGNNFSIINKIFKYLKIKERVRV